MNFDMLLIVVIGLSQLYISTTPQKRNEPWSKFRRRALIAGVLGFAATICLFVRQYRQNSLPEIVLNSHQWKSLQFEAGHDIMLHQEMIVRSGTAKKTHYFCKAFQRYGPPTVEQQREAVNYFKKLMIDYPVSSPDYQKGSILYCDEVFNFDKTQLADLENENLTIYAMQYAKYQNNQGLEIETLAYEYMNAPTHDGIIGFGTISWHTLATGEN
jgi:hypothetical protein